MDKTIDFSEFTRQSSKGIIVIYGNLLITIFKKTWVVFLLLITRISKFRHFDKTYFIVGVICLFVFLFIRSYVLFRNFQFKIEGDNFILKKGIFSKKNTSISLDRIQNINFSQNLIQQLINVYQVSIETAGSNKTEISIKALSLQDAKALKEKISSKDIQEKELEQDSLKPLLTIDAGSLLKVSFSENHLQSLLVFLGLLLGFYQQIEDVFKNFFEEDILKNYVKESKELVFGSFFLIVIVLFVLLIIAIASSFVRVFLFHFNLRFFMKNDAFEIKQGLTNKKMIVLKKGKVQSITISTNPLKKKLGISYVVFKQAVSGKVKKKKEKLIKIVGCKELHLERIKESLFLKNELVNSKKEYPHSYFKFRIAFKSMLWILFINVFLLLFFNSLKTLYFNSIWIPLFLFIAYKKIKKTFFKISENLLLVGKGALETHFTYVEIFKIQNIKLRQTIFQKRRDIIDVVLQTAAGKIIIPCVPYHRAIDIYNYMLYKVEKSTKEWM